MKYKSILILLAIIIGASMILSFIPIQKACGQEEEGCYKVQASEYEETLGMKNAHIGLVAFTILFLINFSHIKKPTKKKKQFLVTGLFIGSLMALYFLYLQFFVLNAICKYCMVADIGTILSFGIILLVKEK